MLSRRPPRNVVSSWSFVSSQIPPRQSSGTASWGREKEGSSQTWSYRRESEVRRRSKDQSGVRAVARTQTEVKASPQRALCCGDCACLAIQASLRPPSGTQCAPLQLALKVFQHCGINRSLPFAGRLLSRHHVQILDRDSNAFETGVPFFVLSFRRSWESTPRRSRVETLFADCQTVAVWWWRGCGALAAVRWRSTWILGALLFGGLFYVRVGVEMGSCGWERADRAVINDLEQVTCHIASPLSRVFWYYASLCRNPQGLVSVSAGVSTAPNALVVLWSTM